MSGSDQDNPESTEPKEVAGEEAAALLRRARFGVLSTLSRRMQGWPFGSVVPYALDRQGALLILVAKIAEHTKNLEADERSSLLVHDEADSDDIQAHGRVTVLARARELPAEDQRDAEARYLARVPSAASYFAAHDFRFLRLVPERVRFIGGFGRIHWLDPEAIAIDPAADPIAPAAQGAIDHLNQDHRDALVLMCRAFAGLEPGAARAVGIDRFGLDLEASEPDRRVRVDFDTPATPESLRNVVVDAVRRARARLSPPR